MFERVYIGANAESVEVSTPVVISAIEYEDIESTVRVQATAREGITVKLSMPDFLLTSAIKTAMVSALDSFPAFTPFEARRAFAYPGLELGDIAVTKGEYGYIGTFEISTNYYPASNISAPQPENGGEMED